MTANNELDLDAALAVLCEQVAPVAAHEHVPALDAHNRILARDLIAPIDLPAFANSAMDGYAVRAADCKGAASLRIVGTAYAGHGFEGVLEPGAAVRITTGAPLPAGADAVVMQEEARRDGESVSFSVDATPGLNVRPRGQHVRTGDVLIAARARLRAPAIGLATAVGVTALPVVRRLHVGVASTGDELVDPPSRPGPAGSIDGTRPMIAAACRGAGFHVSDFGICGDRAAAFNGLLERARLEGVDALLVIGGSALGDADVVRRATQVQYVPLKIRPGRGLTFVRIAGAGSSHHLMLGLPGNAVAAFVMFHLLVLPTLFHLAGAGACIPAHLNLAIAEDLVCEPGRIDYRRGCFERSADGALIVRPLRQQGAGMLRTLVDADALIAAGPQPRYPAGTAVPVVQLAALPG